MAAICLIKDEVLKLVTPNLFCFLLEYNGTKVIAGIVYRRDPGIH